MTPVSSVWDPRSARCQQTLLLLCVAFANTLMRNTMSMALVCMINSTAIARLKSTNETECSNIVVEDVKYEGRLLWDSHAKGVAVSAIFWGGLFAALPAGFIADRYSPKWMLTYCLVVSVTGCVLTPITALRGGLVVAFVLRFMMGFAGQAVIIPAASVITAKWIPPSERSSAMSIYTSGTQIAMIVAGPFNAYLCQQTQILGGWQGIFYFTGIAAVPILVIWAIPAADKPENYKLIKENEQEYIRRSLEQQHLRKKVKWSHVPWKRMLRSLPVLVTLISNFALMVMATTIQSYIPLYFKEALKLNLKKNGLLSALPLLAQWIGKGSSALADRLRKKHRPTLICKIFNSIGAFGSSIFLIIAAYMTCNEAPAAVAFLVISCLLYSSLVPGFSTSLTQIASAYSGIVNSISRCCGQIGAVVAPHIVGAMTTGETASEWRSVFWLVTVVMVVAGLLFLAFGSSEIQEWAKKSKASTKSKSSSSSG